MLFTSWPRIAIGTRITCGLSMGIYKKEHYGFRAFPVGEEPAKEDVERASVTIMDAITAVVAELRGDPAPYS